MESGSSINSVARESDRSDRSVRRYATCDWSMLALQYSDHFSSPLTTRVNDVRRTERTHYGGVQKPHWCPNETRQAVAREEETRWWIFLAVHRWQRLTWSSPPSSDVLALPRRADLGMNRLRGIEGRRSETPVVFVWESSSDRFVSKGFVVCCCGCGATGGFRVEDATFGDESLSGSVEPVFNHFHLLDFGGRCNGGLWLTDVICDTWDSWVSIRSEMVSSLSRCLLVDARGSCSSCEAVDNDDSDGGVPTDGGPSIGSALGGWTVVTGMDGTWDGVGFVEVVAVAGWLGLFCEAARLSWEILRNFEINFRTGWSELIWSKPSCFLVSANSRSRFRSAIFRNTT